MHRHFEYIDNEGQHQAGVQNIPSLPRESIKTVERQGNRLLAHNARLNGWKPFPGEVDNGKPVYLHTFHPDFPLSKRMERINHIRNVNGLPPFYDADQIANADKPDMDITVAQFDKNGNLIPSMVIPPLAREPHMPSVVHNASDTATKVIAIREMGTESPTADIAAPALDGSAPTGPAVKPAPIETR